MKYTVSFTAWYLNPERICQLINSPVLAKELTTLTGAAGLAHVLSDVGIARGIFVRKLEEWLHSNPIPSLAELLLKRRESDRGALFTIYQDFNGRGLSRYSHITGPLLRDAVAELRNKLKYADDKRLRIIYSPKNLISSTAWSRLRGHTRLFCFCYLEDESDSEILARPYRTGQLEIASAQRLESPRIPEISFGMRCRLEVGGRSAAHGWTSGREEPIGTSPFSKDKRPQRTHHKNARNRKRLGRDRHQAQYLFRNGALLRGTIFCAH